ncbi:MAG: hypothetical protein V1790_18850 [Planctomycetota bacterium]
MSVRTRSRVKGANRLIKVRTKESANVTLQTAKFDALGRRIKKVVTIAGVLDWSYSAATGASPGDAACKSTPGPVKDHKTEVYFYEGQRIVQINNGSGAMVQQVIAKEEQPRGMTMVSPEFSDSCYRSLCPPPYFEPCNVMVCGDGHVTCPPFTNRGPETPGLLDPDE